MRKRVLTLLAAALLLCAQPASAAWSALGHTFAQSSGCAAVTTTGQTTTGADLIIISSSIYSASFTPSDNQGNTYTDLTIRTEAGSGNLSTKISYKQAPATAGASGHTFSLGAGGDCPAIFVAWFSGSTATPADGETGNTSGGAGATSLSSNAFTPSTNGDLIVTSTTTNGGAPSYTTSNPASCASAPVITDQAGQIGGNAAGGALAYCVQTTAGSISVTWTQAAANYIPVAIAGFKVSGGGGGCAAASPTLTLMGVGNCKGDE